MEFKGSTGGITLWNRADNAGCEKWHLYDDTKILNFFESYDCVESGQSVFQMWTDGAGQFAFQPSLLNGYLPTLGTNSNKWPKIYSDVSSTTALSATTICISADCRTTWPSGSGASFDTNPFTATYFVATSTTQASSFPLASSTEISTVRIYASSTPITDNPVYSFTTDKDTGIFNPSANRLSFMTGGTPWLQLDTVGALAMVTSGGQNQFLGAGIGDVGFPDFASNIDKNTGISLSNNDTLKIVTGGVSRMFFGPTGKTGVGTTTPGAAFVVGNGDIYVGTTTGAVSGIILEASDETCHRIVVSTLNVISASTVSCP